MADIFLSYAREDRDRAELVARLLESGGWTVFWDAHIKPAAEWRSVLESELDRAAAVIALWSQRSIASSWVTEEAERGRPRLISVRLDDVPIPLGFSERQAVDLVNWRGGRHAELDRLIAAVSETLKAPPPRPPVPPPPAHRKWYAIAALAVVLGAVAVYGLVHRLNAPPPIMNQEIVLDASAGMADTFDNGPTKLAAAVNALRVRNLHPKENLALRDFGGDCGQDDGSPLLVSFGIGRRNRILKAAADLQPRGQPTLASAVISAMADLHPFANTKRVVVLTGHADTCHEEAVRDIKERLAAYKAAGQDLALEMRFIGLSVSESDQKRIREISDAVAGRAYFVDTVAELNEVLEYVIEFEPALTYVKAVSDVVGQLRQAMNEVADDVNRHRYDEARKTLDAGRVTYARIRPSFDALAGQRPGANFERFYSLAGENRSLQQQVFDIASITLGQASKDGKNQTPEYEKSIEQWNALINKYNANIGEMDRIVQEIVKEVRKRG
jgi:hypothetical protein